MTAKTTTGRGSTVFFGSFVYGPFWDSSLTVPVPNGSTLHALIGGVCDAPDEQTVYLRPEIAGNVGPATEFTLTPVGTVFGTQQFVIAHARLNNTGFDQNWIVQVKGKSDTPQSDVASFTPGSGWIQALVS